MGGGYGGCQGAVDEVDKGDGGVDGACFAGSTRREGSAEDRKVREAQPKTSGWVASTIMGQRIRGTSGSNDCHPSLACR